LIPELSTAGNPGFLPAVKSEVAVTAAPSEHAAWFEAHKTELAEDIRTMYKAWGNKTKYSQLLRTADKLARRVDIEIGDAEKKGDTYCPEVGERIAAMIAVGGTFIDVEKLTGISIWKIIRWRLKHHDFRRLLERAYEESPDMLVEESLNAVRSAHDIFALKKSEILSKVTQWIAQRRNPSKYGDVQKHEVKSMAVVMDYQYRRPAPASSADR